MRDGAAAVRARSVQVGLDCGTDDQGGLPQGRELHALLKELDVPHRYLEHSGAHDWTYWGEHVQDGLAQHAAALRGARAPRATAAHRRKETEVDPWTPPEPT